MPRRTGHAAKRRALETLISRWQLLLRNPQFRTDLNHVRRMDPQGDIWNETLTEDEAKELASCRSEYGEDSSKHVPRSTRTAPVESYPTLLTKWRLNRLPQEFFKRDLPDLSPETVAKYEKMLARSFTLSRLDPNPASRYFSRPAVLADDPAITYCEINGEVHPYLRLGEELRLTLDLSYPQDVLEALIGEELKKAIVRRKERQRRGFLPKTEQRGRVDKLGFQLAVYDLVERGKDFDEVARILGKRTRTVKGRLNTVRSAYVVACQKIGPHLHGNESHTEPIHDCEQCPVCKVAKTAVQLCPRAKTDLKRHDSGLPKRSIAYYPAAL